MVEFVSYLTTLQLTRQTHQACLAKLIETYEQAMISGLCAQGAWDLAVDQLKHMELPLMGKIKVKRIYDSPATEDGNRVLVDRLWPRGMCKGDAQIDCWAKELAPSTELRQWFNHTPERFDAFVEKYRKELKDNQQAIEKRLTEMDARRAMTFLTATKDLQYCHASVLKQYIQTIMK